ncbi:DMT family transporter [Chondromyces crocatus]|uniref:Membrane protein n=1 Tax=Chondromyces crocatus TaxID=52 RepID=A0A0K1EM62_CHOCO|nr:DMT family transporter [Chondromyces crocatus]AKT41737.1 membrane protein [Chondromyces crocatus]
MTRRRSDIAAGAGLAALAALSFGLTTPVVERSGRGVGAFSTAAVLYAGASIAAFALGCVATPDSARLSRQHLGRLFAMAVFGAGVAPTLLAWGVQRSGATTGSLLLNLEAVFTVLLAWRFYREPLGRRVVVALLVMALGGVALTMNAASSVGFDGLGAAAITGATLAWALDNTLSRGLAEQDPSAVVASKGALGAALTGAIAWMTHDPWPRPGPALVLLACGATGYGLSLRLYLLAQRRMGAARTGSVFALAPFIGASLGWALGDQPLGPWTLLSASLFAVGVALHITERHEHHHVHPAMKHDHPHRHDDGHHDHVHDPPFFGEHTHAHHHHHVEHAHDHAPDIHHDHDHEHAHA